MGAVDPFRTEELAGWVIPGAPDRQVLLLHGGPGLGPDYLLPLAESLAGWTVASFQQRGLPPSTTGGSFDVPTAVADVADVLDALGWERPIVAGHSWGGLLAWHVGAALGDRVGGLLAIDAMGAVGDMGMPAFGAELVRRLSPDAARALSAWEAIESERPLTESEQLAVLELLWPSYFADPADVPPFAAASISLEANTGLLSSAVEHQAALLEGLPGIRVPAGALVGARSPIPATATTETSALIPGAWVDVVADAGHFVWFEQPACVAAALEKLVA